MNKQIDILFSSADKSEWLRTVSQWCADNVIDPNVEVSVEFGEAVSEKNLEPFHYVLFACFAEYCTQRESNFNHKTVSNSDLHKYMYEVLTFNRYWLDNYVYKNAMDGTVLNIWKVSDTEKEPHSQRIHDYFKRKYFADRDLSALRLGLLELYYNVFDHAKAEGNAFSLLRYDEQTHKLHIAIGDMGVGIACSIRQTYPSKNDSNAIVNAVQTGITAGSQSHNKGMGLDNIAGMLFDDNTLNIVSNCGQVVIKGTKKDIDSWENNFNFPGTLIWLDVSMDQFEKEERMDNFSWDDV